MLTKQQWFNNAWNGIHAQGKAAVEIRLTKQFPVEGVAVCVYRMPDDSKCAIGHSIIFYEPQMEGQLVEYLFENGDIRGDLQFLQELQACHDENALHIGRVFRTVETPSVFIKEFERDMHEMARRWKLEVPCPK